MTLNRGDVVMTRFPHTSGARGKKRPAVVIQADTYITLRHILVAEITKNLSRANDPAFVLVDISTADGKASGLDQSSLVSGLFVATISADRIDRVIGHLTANLMQKVDDCLKAAMALN